MNILITGIHGFVGTNLVKVLQGDHKLYGLDIVSPKVVGVEKTYTWSDLLDGRIEEPIDAIIHLAGKAHDVKNEAGAEIYFEVNTELTKKIYDYFIASEAKKFIFFSSVKAAADFVPGEILTEDVVPAPVGPYGESKIKAEEYILSNLPTDKQVYIVRPCMIHGPGNKGNLNLLYAVISKGIPWPLGSFENRRSFTSIDNLSFVVGELLIQNVESGIYHMGDDEALSTNELIETICIALDKKARIWRLPKGLMEFAATLGTTLHLPLNKERLTKLVENYVVSNAKIKKALNIDKMPTSAQEGLIKTIQSFQQNN